VIPLDVNLLGSLESGQLPSLGVPSPLGLSNLAMNDGRCMESGSMHTAIRVLSTPHEPFR
jgi:hypothetical protein